MAGVVNIVADTLNILLSTTIDRDKLITTRALRKVDQIFVTRVEQTLDELYPLELTSVQQ